MRTKALIVGAMPSIEGFKGPWVNLEEGKWLVEPPFDLGGKVHIVDEQNVYITLHSDSVRLAGPTRIRVEVWDYEGSELHLHAAFCRIRRKTNASLS